MSGDFDPLVLEEHARFAAENGSGRKGRRRAKQLAEELARLELLEARMRRAFRAWDAQRGRVARLEKLADRELLE